MPLRCEAVLLDSANLLKSFLLLLTDVILQTCLSVRNVTFEIAADNCNFVEAVTERILGSVKALLGSSQILVGEINAPVQGVDRLIGVADDLRLRLLQVGLN